MSTDAATMNVGQQLVDLCNQGRHLEAVETLYADDVVSVEAFEMPGHPKELRGKEAVLGKSKWFKGPYPCADGRFAAWMSMDITPREGPMAGKRLTMEEVCLYYVENGRITREEFFYGGEDCSE